MQSLLHSKLTELQKKRTKEDAALDQEAKNDGTKELYTPPAKRRVKEERDNDTEGKKLPQSDKSDVESSKNGEKENDSTDVENTSPKKLDFSSFFDFPSDFSSRSWVDIIEEEERRAAEEVTVKVEVVSSESNEKDEKEEKPKALLSSSSKIRPNPKEDWAQPAKGWCWEESTLIRREKEIQRMKERATYHRYVSAVPRYERQKGVHPKTPNKYLNWSRRSWDKQIKLWKLAIYEWAGETPTSSVNASYCPSECSDDDIDNKSDSSFSSGPMAPKRIKLENEVTHEMQLANVNIPSHPDAMASLLGHFDLDTLRGAPTLIGPADEESTLKHNPVIHAKSYYATAVATEKIVVNGPTDFSHLNPVKSAGVEFRGEEEMGKAKRKKAKAK